MSTVPPAGGTPPPPQGPPPGPPPGGPPPGGLPPGGPPPGGPPPPAGDGGSGVDPKIANVISYIIGIIGGVIFYLIEKRDTEVRFHAVQSVLFHVFFAILATILSITIIGLVLVPFVILAEFIGAIYLAIQGYNQKHIKLPVIGDISEQWAVKNM